MVLEHRWVIILGIIVSLLCALPQMYFRIDHRTDGVYQGIELLPDSPWSARAREVMDGHPWFGNIYNKDGKDQPYLFQPLGSIITAYTGELFSFNINNTLLLSRLVFPFIVTILIYSFVFLISRDKLAALTSTAILLLADSVLRPFGVMQILHGKLPDEFLRLSRPVNPAMIYVFFFGFLVSFWYYYKNRTVRYGILSAVLLGLNFYNYLYTWTYLYAFGGLLVLFHMYERQWKEVKKLSYVFFGALIVGIPYLINLYKVTTYPTYEEVGARFGVVLTHMPLFVGFTVIIAIFAFLFFFPKKDTYEYYFNLALVLTPFITMNQQIITGKILQPNHYHWFFHKPVVIIVICIVIFSLLTRLGWTRLRALTAGAMLVVSVATGAFIQYVSYHDGFNDGGAIAIERQKFGPIMEWLNVHAEREAMVFANNEASHITVIYTPLNVFYHRALPFASLSATKARQLETLFTFYRLRGVGYNDAREAFYADREQVSAEIYGIYYQTLLGSYSAIPDEKIDEIVALYQETLSTPKDEWLMNVWKKYEVEYFIWDKKNDPLWHLEKYPFLKEVAVSGDLSIYQFSQ